MHFIWLLILPLKFKCFICSIYYVYQNVESCTSDISYFRNRSEQYIKKVIALGKISLISGIWKMSHYLWLTHIPLMSNLNDNLSLGFLNGLKVAVLAKKKKKNIIIFLVRCAIFHFLWSFTCSNCLLRSVKVIYRHDKLIE